MLGVSNHAMNKGKKQGKRGKKDVKVTYISSPMKVKTSASKFRAVVQELTGQDSNVAEMFMEANGADDELLKKGSTQQQRSQAYLPDATWLKRDSDYNELLDSRSSSMEPLNEHPQYDLLNFDMLY